MSSHRRSGIRRDKLRTRIPRSFCPPRCNSLSRRAHPSPGAPENERNSLGKELTGRLCLLRSPPRRRKQPVVRLGSAAHRLGLSNKGHCAGLHHCRLVWRTHCAASRSTLFAPPQARGKLGWLSTHCGQFGGTRLLSFPLRRQKNTNSLLLRAVSGRASFPRQCKQRRSHRIPLGNDASPRTCVQSSRDSRRPRLGHPKTRSAWRPARESPASLFRRCSAMWRQKLCSLLPGTRMFSGFFAEPRNRLPSKRAAASRARRSSEDQTTRLLCTSTSFVASFISPVLNMDK